MAFEDDAMEPRLPVDAKAFLRIGEPLVIEASCAQASIRFEGPIIEQARTKAVSEEEAREPYRPPREHPLLLRVPRGVGRRGRRHWVLGAALGAHPSLEAS